MSSPYLKIGLACALFATALGITFYSVMPGEPANDYRYNGLSQAAVPPPPPPAPMAPPPPPPPPVIVEEEVVYKVVEQMPLFPGCDDTVNYTERKSCADQKMIHYVYNKVDYPQEAREKGKEGVAVVRFKVSATGKVFGEELVRDPGAGMGEEALRVVKTMREDDIRWTPGSQNGKQVTVQYNLPVRFRLE